MASGMGRRFGGNKLMADFHGEPMIMRILAATEGLFARRVVVTRHEDIASICRTGGIPVILHTLPDRSDTVRLGLEAVGDVQGCLFCPSDQPLLRRETISALAAAAVSDTQSIWRPVCGGTPSSPVLFPRWAFDELMHLPAGMGGGYVVRKHPDRVRTFSVSDPRELMDADDPETLEILLQADKQLRI